MVTLQNSDTNVAKFHPELQHARCMSSRYKNEEFPRCVSCTRRWAGDTCRFQGIRFFLKDESKKNIGVSFLEAQKADAPSMHFPTEWNVSLTKENIAITKVGTVNYIIIKSLTRFYRERLPRRSSKSCARKWNMCGFLRLYIAQEKAKYALPVVSLRFLCGKLRLLTFHLSI